MNTLQDYTKEELINMLESEMINHIGLGQELIELFCDIESILENNNINIENNVKTRYDLSKCFTEYLDDNFTGDHSYMQNITYECECGCWV